MRRPVKRPTARQTVIAAVAALALLAPAFTPAEGAAVADPLEEVTLVTDAYGVTHIYADSEYALFYANGYVQARDRLFQMDVLRHVGYGDSASVIGPSQLASDIQVRRDLYDRQEIVAAFEAMPEAHQRILEAYSDGVNRYMSEAAARDALPAEFAAIGHAPEPWTPYDSVASINYLIGYFGVAGGGEVGNAQTLHQLARSLDGLEAGYAAYGDVNWLRVTDSYTTISPADKTLDGGEDAPALEDVPQAQLDLLEAATRARPFGVHADVAADDVSLGQRQGAGLFKGFHWGSNALLVGGGLTATGEAIMFGGPQMGYYKPPIPYEVGLHGAGYDVTGMGVATAPGVVIGRTPTFAWSVTSGIDDQVDTVALELDPTNYQRYRWDGEWRTMDCEQVVHRTTPNPGAPDGPRVVLQEVCRAHGMPVVAWSPADSVAWAQRVTTRGEELAGAFMWLQLGKQTDLQGFMDALRDFPFTFNYHYAGSEGIAYIHTGDVPQRAPGYDPRLPTPAGSAYEWQGELVGWDDMGTYVVNPTTGYAAQWNNAPAKGWRAGDSAGLWGSVHRVQVLDHFVQQRLDETGGALTWSDVDEILELAATHDPFARHSAPHMVHAAGVSGDARLQPLAGALADWGADDYPWRDANGDDAYDDPGHAVWDATRLALQDLVFRDELGPRTPALDFNPPTSSDPHAGDHGQHNNKDTLLVDALNGRTSHDWCDDVTTSAAETCGDMLVAALRRARDDLAAAHGTTDVSQWLLPEHKSRFAPIGAGHADEIDMVNRGSWNQVVSIGQGLDQSGGVLPPGNSGLLTPAEAAIYLSGSGPEPPRLTAQLDLYTGFDYKPLPWTRAQVDALAERTETLTVPAP